MKKVFLLLFFVLLRHLLYPQEYSNQLHSDSTFLKPDYRNRINIPEYNKTLMQLKKISTNSGTWTEVNPKVPRVDYFGIHFFNKDTGWAVGANGVIIKTTDGGEVWRWIKSNLYVVLKTVGSYNGKTIVIAGDYGTVLLSTDLGENWQLVDIGTKANLWNVKFINENIVWLVGEDGSCYKSTDGGFNWKIIVTPLGNLSHWDMSFLDVNYGFICSDYGKVIKTTDGGNTWQSLQAGDNHALYTIVVLDSLHIVAGGELVKFVYSEDGGENWNQTLLSQDLPINKIAFKNDTLGYAIGNASSAYRTTDKGITWETIQKIGEWNMCFVNDTIGYNVGEKLKIYKTCDGGFNWQKSILNEDFSKIWFLNESEGWIVADTLLYHSSNGGTSWVVNRKFPYGYPTGTLSSLCFLDGLTGFIGTQLTGIYGTSDSGNVWEKKKVINLLDTLGFINDIYFISKNIGWGITSRGGILKTNDGGENWFAQLNIGSSINFNSIYFIDSLIGWTANKNRNPFKTVDGGTNWIEQTSLNITQADDIFFIDYLNGFILEEGKLYKTTDGGNTWSVESNPIGFSVAKFSHYDDSTIFIIGYEKSYSTIDGGKNWQELSDLNGITIKNISLINSGLGYACGEMGLILKYIDSTAIPTVVQCNLSADVLSNEVFLYQNYPNPFNPVTKLKFKSGKSGFAKLILYNLLGEKIKKLFEGNIESNKNYEITFNALDYASGIYFYELIQGNKGITRKMILSK